MSVEAAIGASPSGNFRFVSPREGREGRIIKHFLGSFRQIFRACRAAGRVARQLPEFGTEWLFSIALGPRSPAFAEDKLRGDDCSGPESGILNPPSPPPGEAGVRRAEVFRLEHRLSWPSRLVKPEMRVRVLGRPARPHARKGRGHAPHLRGRKTIFAARGVCAIISRGHADGPRRGKPEPSASRQSCG